MVTFANVGSVRPPSLNFEVRRPSRSEDTAHLVCQLSIYNSFPVIRTTIAKKIIFTYPGFHFFCPGDAHAEITQNVAWMKRQFSACQTPRSMYSSIFNSFQVIRWLSQCVSPKIAIFTTFWFSLETPLWQLRKTLNKWIDNSVLAKPLAACTQLSSTVSQLFELREQKIAVFTYSSPYFCFPWRRPCEYHAMCCMDGKTIQCLPNPSQHVPIYIQ